MTEEDSMIGTTLISIYFGLPETSLRRLPRRSAIDALCAEKQLA
ncbi:MAG: hypothetical protein JWR83_2747 [Aeromicrobium sp.]|nr:hypothetical protein [Aeromicrobium sp.]